MAPKNAAIYVRISDDREELALGVVRQEKDCRALAKSRGWEVGEVFRDNDVSAWNGHRRPEYERMLEAIRTRIVDGVIVWHLDRLHRSPRELEDFFEVCDAAKLTNLATVTGDVNLAEHQGRLHARLMGSVAKYESDQKGHRIRRKHEELAAAGKLSGGGTRPFGFQKDRITVNAPEAALIRKAVDAVIAERPVRTIAKEWAALGVRSPLGKEFGPNAVRRLLRSARIAGLREHHGEIVGKAVWPAIVPVAKAATARAILSDPKRTTRRAARVNLLAGFAVCGLCGAILRGRPQSSGVRAYICKAGPGAKGCGRIGIVATKLEERIAEMVFYRVDTKPFARKLAAKHRATDDALYEAVAEDEAMLATLADDFTARRVTRAEWLRARDTVQKRLDAGRQRLGALNGNAALAPYVASGALRVAWGRMDLDGRRAVLSALITRIVIAPAPPKGALADAAGRRVFDPRRAAVEWKF
jgi:DNA invertase Pin-like site-specific DNA recombinase